MLNRVCNYPECSTVGQVVLQLIWAHSTTYSLETGSFLGPHLHSSQVPLGTFSPSWRMRVSIMHWSKNSAWGHSGSQDYLKGPSVIGTSIFRFILYKMYKLFIVIQLWVISRKCHFSPCIQYCCGHKQVWPLKEHTIKGSDNGWDITVVERLS